MEDDQEFDGFATQSESKLNYAGTKDHPAELYVDHDEPSLYDKREKRARATIGFIKRLNSLRFWLD